MNLIFLGPPGAGKGTVAQKITDDMDIVQISTGDLLRGAVKEGTELGIKAKEYMDKGKLVPDELVIGLLKDRISKEDCKNGFILDGFPRTIPQAEALDNSDVEIDKVVNFNVPDELVIHRITGRRICKECNAVYNIYPDCDPNPKEKGKCDKCSGELYQRDDDREEVVMKRLKQYKEQTEPLVDYYKEKGILANIKADNPLDEIVEDTKKAVKS
ncbi:adenylate kinase [Candidatus Woesearchaeota archaeon]|nr:adenylate kinase [Candidatus Woesearchaeota archaeon]